MRDARARRATVGSRRLATIAARAPIGRKALRVDDSSNGTHTISLQALLPLLNCPRTKQPLVQIGDRLATEDGAHEYPLQGGIPDLRVAPPRLSIDVPWFEPWDELDALDLTPPARAAERNLPYHMEAEFA